MTIYLHEDDLPNNLNFNHSIAIDTETMGLKTKRDRLCLIQISSGDGDAHLVKIKNAVVKSTNKHKNLIKVLQNKNALFVVKQHLQ